MTQVYNRQLLIDRLHELERFIPGLHQDSKSLQAPCPKCGGTDRFWSSYLTNYTLFTCRCGHTQRYGDAWTVAPAAAVKPYVAPVTHPGRIEAIRSIYQLLTHFAQPHIGRGLDYLKMRGFDPLQYGVILRRTGMGYLDTQLYRQWYSGLGASERHACEWAGLPDGSRDRYTGHAAMFAGGHQGKILLPYYDATGAIFDIRTRSISNKDTVGDKPIRYVSPKGTAQDRGATVPYGVHLAGDARVFVIVEGEFKAIAANILANVATLGLRGTNDWQPEYDDLLRGKLAILAFDNDTNGAGAQASLKLGRQLVAQDIDVLVLDPTLLGNTKGPDDYIFAHGGAAFRALISPSNLITLPEYEQRLLAAGVDLTKFTTPRADVGTVRQWLPEAEVETFAHPKTATMTVDEATDLIKEKVTKHLKDYRRGRAQVLVTAPAGVGKTKTTIETTLTHAATTDQTVAVILPNHATIDEKIADGTLPNFRHVYGHNDDNCQQNATVQALARKGYTAGVFVCPTCPSAKWCATEGYKAQFTERENRAYVHAHAFTSYPENEDIVIVDELGHKPFVANMQISQSDLSAALASGTLPTAPQALLNGLLALWNTPGLRDLEGGVFYATLERFFPGLSDVDAWGDGSFVQGALFDAATAFVNGEANAVAEKLPQQFGETLIALLTEDVRRLNKGQAVTGRVRFVAVDASRRWLELIYSRGNLPGWYNTRPTIILNATANAEIMQDLVGPLDVVAPQVAVAEGNEIIQDITYNNAKSAYVGNSAETEKRRAAWLAGIRTHIAAHPGGETDTTLIAAKVLAPQLRVAFPQAKLAHYGALEGRNDLQSGLTILASAVPVNPDAIVREAQALYPGIDTTKLRRNVAFDSTNAAGEYMAVAQIDAADPRLSALIAQHRDAMATQAVHRSRVVRQTGRKIVVMFSRPIPGLPPTRIIADRPSSADKRASERQDRIDKLVATAADLLEQHAGFRCDELAEAAGLAVNTAKKYLGEVCKALRINSLNLPVLQPLAKGQLVTRTIEIILRPEIAQKITMHVNHDRNNINLITNVIYVHLAKFLPNAWRIDVAELIKTITPPALEPAVPPPATVAPPGRWGMAPDAQAVEKELQRAATSNHAEKRLAGTVLCGYLDATHDNKMGAHWAIYELGLAHLLDWGRLVRQSYA